MLHDCQGAARPDGRRQPATESPTAHGSGRLQASAAAAPGAARDVAGGSHLLHHYRRRDAPLSHLGAHLRLQLRGLHHRRPEVCVLWAVRLPGRPHPMHRLHDARQPPPGRALPRWLRPEAGVQRAAAQTRAAARHSRRRVVPASAPRPCRRCSRSCRRAATRRTSSTRRTASAFSLSSSRRTATFRISTSFCAVRSSDSEEDEELSLVTSRAAGSTVAASAEHHMTPRDLHRVVFCLCCVGQRRRHDRVFLLRSAHRACAHSGRWRIPARRPGGSGDRTTRKELKIQGCDPSPGPWAPLSGCLSGMHANYFDVKDRSTMRSTCRCNHVRLLLTRCRAKHGREIEARPAWPMDDVKYEHLPY